MASPLDTDGPTDGRALFVYWRVDPAALPAVRAAVHRAQAALAGDWPGLQVRLWERVDGTSGSATVMETYAAPGGIDAAGQARIDATMAPCVPAPRHVEAFVPAAGVRG